MPIERLVKTFSEIVQIDSPTGFEAKMGEDIARRITELGFSPQIDRQGNVLTFIPGNRQEPLFLGAHLDTVEPGRGIVPKIEGGVIKSSGETILGADNKSTVTAILELLTGFRDNVEQEHRPLEVVFTVSEESANNGALALDYSKIKAKEGYIFDSSNPVGTIIIASPFYDRFDIQMMGKSAHASRPEEANNSVAVLGFALNRINLGKISSNTLVNVGVITTGETSVRNTIPGEMIVRGEVRSFVEEELVEASKRVQAGFEEALAAFGSKAEMSFVRENGGYKYSENDPLVLKAVQTILSVGLKPSFQEAWGCSDGNIFVDKGLKVLNFGDGTVNTHTKEEYISIDELNNLFRLLSALVI